MLSPAQVAQYREQGYLLIRDAVADADIQRLERGLARNPPLDGTLAGKQRYPEAGRYTLATNSLKDPDLAFIVEHPTLVGAAADLLGDDPRLTAYVIYDRTPGGPGLPGHNDYKRWRPVGSSMNWLFTIVPFDDFDEAAGPLYIAPGSHEPERVHPGADRPLEIGPPTEPPASAFIDPGLRRGDLLLMNMYLWHKADGNRSDRHRVGLFNKYAAANAPPATGYYLYDNDVHAALSAEGQRLIAVHSDRSIDTTRAVLLQPGRQGREILMVDSDSGLELPGGTTWDERAIPDWDLGNHIAPLKEHLREQLGIDPPWVSYVGDYDENAHLCRVYGYDLTGRGFPVPYRGARWLPVDELTASAGRFGYERAALDAWLDPAPVRGKGLTQAQCRIDQYAY